MYSLIRNILFLFEAEKAHYISMNMLKMVCSVSVFKKIVRALFSSNHISLNRKLFGLHFKNPIGLGAGFDKNATYLRELETLGFGFVEIGTVTPLPQEGNEKPRLFRLPNDKALINRMGFNNEGVKAIKSRLEQWKTNNESIPDGKRMIIGGNIGKNKNTPNEEAWKDYEICFTELFDVVDYFVVNVSSPNTPGLRALQDKDALTNILQRLQNLNNQKPNRKPLLLKIAPDLTSEQLQDIAEISSTVKLDGIVSSNTTISRENLSSPSQIAANKIGMGGLSGRPLKNASDEVLKQLIRMTNGKIPIIASGGIFTAKDAEDKIELGASLLQVWTGFVYVGPGLVKTISKNLIK